MLKKIYFLFFIFFVFACESFASYEDKLSELEHLRYGKTFQSESLSERLFRLEEDYFGLSQSGDINSRINMLMKMAHNNYPNQLSYDRKEYYSQSKQGRLKNFFRNMASAFFDSGAMTGYIPPVDVYDNTCGYNNSFETDYYNRFFSPPKYSPSYIPAHSYNYPHVHQPILNSYSPGYSTSNIQYDRYGYPSVSNRDLYARSAVKILRDWFYTIKKRLLL